MRKICGWKEMLLVLIYPYWNVNNFFCGIYRNVIKGFNLSILECKLVFFATIKTSRSVLIYPYWNVNPIDTLQKGWMPRFNLSILECKCDLLGAYDDATVVLIYPYWNVNWGYPAHMSSKSGFNLSILEPQPTHLQAKIAQTLRSGRFFNSILSIRV